MVQKIKNRQNFVIVLFFIFSTAILRITKLGWCTSQDTPTFHRISIPAQSGRCHGVRYGQFRGHLNPQWFQRQHHRGDGLVQRCLEGRSLRPPCVHCFFTILHFLNVAILHNTINFIILYIKIKIICLLKNKNSADADGFTQTNLFRERRVKKTSTKKHN